MRQSIGMAAWVGFFLLMASVVSCQRTSPTSAADPAKQLADAHAGDQIVGVIIADFSDTSSTSLRETADDEAKRTTPAIMLVKLDLGNSRGRATALPFRPIKPPLLVMLSPQGVILSRDESLSSDLLMRQRFAGAVSTASAVDKELKLLQTAVTQQPESLDARRRLAMFFTARKNASEAIPHLRAVIMFSHADIATRIAATVELCRSHLWIGEPEKSRQTAQRLLADLGPTSPDAIAAANLILATQDITAKRFQRGRDELIAAVKASPESSYGVEAAIMLEQLPKEKP